MKILEVNDYGYIAGGAESYFFNLAEALRVAGHEVLTLSSDCPAPKNKFLSDRQVAASGHIFNLDGIFNPINYFQFRQILAEFSPDIVHFHNIFYALSASIIHAANNYKTFLTLHDCHVICFGDKRLSDNTICNRSLDECEDCSSSTAGLLEKIRKRSAAAALKKVRKLIAPSFYTQRQFELNGFENVTRLSHPMIARESDEEREIFIKEKKYFLYIGRLAEQKGVALLLRAFSRIEVDGILHIAGVGPQEAYLKALAQELGIDTRVIFDGWVDVAQRNLLLSEAIVVVVPSICPENSPMVVGEAALQKVSVIAAEAGGLGETVINQETGLIFRHNDEMHLAEKLNYAFKNKEQMRKLGVAAWEKARTQTYSQHVKFLEELWAAN